MRRILILLAVLLCLGALVLPVSARNGAESVQMQVGVADDGSCAIDMTVKVNFDAGVDNPGFPVPGAATEITLNGDAVTGTTRKGITWISLRSVGDGTFHLRYRLPGVVTTEKDQPMMLDLPLLSGFQYPVDKLEFTITLPGDIVKDVNFTSSYYQNNASSILDITVEGPVLKGKAENLKDHETLSMSMEVDAKMFPNAAKAARAMNLVDIAAVVIALVAVAYYLLVLRPKLPRRSVRTDAPDGVYPGDTSLWFYGRPVDFSMLVVTWAQLGYLRIQLEDHGRVLLHKRMEMGNERSVFENHYYRALFGRRRVVDGSSLHYAQLCRYANKKRPYIRAVYKKNPVFRHIFPVLCAVSGLLSGITMAVAFAPYAIFLRILLATLCTIMSVLIFRGAGRIWERKRLPMFVALGCIVLWLLLGALSGTFGKSLLMVLFLIVAGMAGSVGGKRTDPGQQAMHQLLALRRHMATTSKAELQRQMKANPAYFHDLAPYALALGADRSFGRRFGRMRLPECTWLIGRHRGQMSASEWIAMLRTAVDALDARAKRLPLERLLKNNNPLDKRQKVS